MNKSIKYIVIIQVILLILGVIYYDDTQFMSPSWGSLAIATLLIPVVIGIYITIRVTKKPINNFSHIAFIINLLPVVFYFAILPFLRSKYIY